MTNTARRPAPRRLVGVSVIAGWFGVASSTVHKWIDSNGSGRPPFPTADVEIPTAREGVVILGWEPSREAEIRDWKLEIGKLPGRAWRRGITGDVRYTTHEHIGRRPGRTHKR